MAEYYKELIEINEDFVQQLRKGKRLSPNKIRSMSILISMQEMQLLCDGIFRQKERILPLCPEAVNLAEKYFHFSI